MKTRATTQIARKSTRWLRSSTSFGYTRLFASAVPPTEQEKPEAVPPELGNVPSRPWKSSGTQAGSITPTSTSPSSQFYVPSVVIPAEAAKSGPVHKIHILGEDVRSRFIAHALCSVYDSVETVPFRGMPKSRYRNVEKVQPERTRKNAYVEKNAAMPENDTAISENDVVPQPDRSHIDELIVTGRGFEAVKAIASVKDRIDDKTSICLLNEGMGVLEQVREQLFNGTQPEPNFYLGHMSHALAFNRNRGSVKQLKSGRTVFTKADPVLNAEKGLYVAVEQQPSMMRSLRRVKELNTTFSTYEHWLRFKLPSVMFTAAVEPVCVLLDISYQGLLKNRNAQRMMNQLLAEMALVTENMPEVQDSPDLIRFLRGEGLKKFCYRRITGKSEAPSDLLRRINKGLQTDINYQNGYFLRRARILGIDTPTNELMIQMIKARRTEELEKLRSYIPVREASPDDVRKRTQQRVLDSSL
ncbi:2-dehydropantoate 2-reductase [Fusarium sp. NRRL 52700]|nr:2-dehydropantoate 2-reductase [Fusarium sp. NRRL 52700]